ncbi:MAG: hypothetical protein A2Y10_03630 [Planctomycetes bacterium GWF2_41_51]|nr:MAG: hypothetical protein A2Y10_03630 [Planctomycetes bacterium GWF2_41_51]HBG28834.1 hypothetical protein [Phycisphaerales bacterium]
MSKNFNVSYVCILVCSFFIFSADAATVAYWELDGAEWNGLDSVGGYNLTEVGDGVDSTSKGTITSPDLSPWNGANDSATNPRATFFTGTAYYLPNSGGAEHDATFDLDVNKSFTVEGWFKPSSSSTKYIVGVRHADSSMFGNAYKGWSLAGNTSGLTFYLDGASTSGTGISLTSGAISNDIHHFAAVWDAQAYKARLYVDGILKSEVAGSTQWTLHRGGSLMIGARKTAETVYDYYSGAIDEIRFSDEALAPKDFLNYTAAYWELDGQQWQGNDAIGSYNLSKTGTAIDSGLRIDPIPNPDDYAGWHGFNSSTQNLRSTWFDGTLAYYYLNPAETHDSTFDFDPAKSFTVEGWFSIYSSTAWIVGNRTGNIAHGVNGLWKGWSVQVQTNGTELVFLIDGVAGTGYSKQISAGITPEQLVHFAAVWDAAAYQMRLYVNGELISSGAGDANWTFNRGGQISIGGRDAGTGYNDWMASGRIDEIRYSKAVLTPDNFLNKYPPCGAWGYLKGDLNKDCSVDFLDFAFIAENWLECDANVTNCN